MSTALYIFGNDLRLRDNEALLNACKNSDKLILAYIYDTEDEQNIGAASKWWLHKSLQALEDELQESGAKLHLFKGDTFKIISKLIKDHSIDSVYFHRRYEPKLLKRQDRIMKLLKEQKITCHLYQGALLLKPGEMLNKAGKPYLVFTPFYNAALKTPIREPFPKPKSFPKASKKVNSLKVEDFELLPQIHWYDTFEKVWKPGEVNSLNSMKHFVKDRISHYARDRDIPSRDGVSRLSAALHFGEITPYQIWHEAKKTGKLAEAFLRQLIWREFAHHLIFFFPHTTTRALKSEYDNFAWKLSAKNLKAWQRGETGYPIVDAAMKQLWKTGWMHNRLRLLVASFLVKDLLIPWQKGLVWFHDTLVDADLANNVMGWQWVAGSGADAAPYFRIFNPISQGEKFDPKGEFIKEYLPKLSKLPEKWIHKPWQAPEEILQKAGIKLGKDYPYPIINHDEARKEALKTYYKLVKNAHL